MTDSDTTVLSVTYVSTASRPLSQTALDALLMQSRANNAQAGLTGLLAVRGDDFFQVVEGPVDAIQRLLKALRRDNRHIEMRVLLEEELPYRQFPDWTMRCERLDGHPIEAIPGYRSTFKSSGATEPAPHGFRQLIQWLQHRASHATLSTDPDAPPRA